jgi:hypothetical protein
MSTIERMDAISSLLLVDTLLFLPEPKRAARYQIMFGKTHSFLAPRNGMVPDTAHILLHVATAATLIVLLVK